jgi:hypothetical protein
VTKEGLPDSGLGLREDRRRKAGRCAAVEEVKEVKEVGEEKARNRDSGLRLLASGYREEGTKENR